MMIWTKLYFFVIKNLTIKFITISRQRCFETNNKIKESFILSRDTLIFRQKLQLRMYLLTISFKQDQ